MVDEDSHTTFESISNYKTITEVKSLKKIAKDINKKKLFSIDLETTSINALEAEIVGIAISLAENEGFYIPVAHLSKNPQLELNEFIDILKIY